MFADITGSTKLYDTLGDERAKAIISSTLNLLKEVIARYKGTVIKTIGDEVMCSFEDGEAATKAASDMMESVDEANESGATEMPVQIHIGYHFGPCIEEDGDLNGDAVNVAARMTSQAKARQIITTAETASQLPFILQDNTRFVDRAAIKGKGEVEIVEYIWQSEDVTQMSASVPKAAAATRSVQLHLKYKDIALTLNSEREMAVLGRSPACDIPVAETQASRQHIRIELRRDKFYLVDQSTNGTWVQSEGRQLQVRREEIPLSGEGVISLGRAFEDNPQELVHFKLED